MYIWMAVTADKYELPIAVADTATKLGEMFGIKCCTVVDYATKNKSGKTKGRKFVRVKLDESEEDDENKE